MLSRRLNIGKHAVKVPTKVVKGMPNRDGSVDLFHIPMKSDDGYVHYQETKA